MALPPTPQQLWEGLEDEAWAASATSITNRGRATVLRAAQNAWTGGTISAAQQTTIANAIQRWRDAELQLTNVNAAPVGPGNPVLLAFQTLIQVADAGDKVIAALDLLIVLRSGYPARDLEQGSIGNAREYVQEEARLDDDLATPAQVAPNNDSETAFRDWIDTCRASWNERNSWTIIVQRLLAQQQAVPMTDPVRAAVLARITLAYNDNSTEYTAIETVMRDALALWMLSSITAHADVQAFALNTANTTQLEAHLVQLDALVLCCTRFTQVVQDLRQFRRDKVMPIMTVSTLPSTREAELAQLDVDLEDAQSLIENLDAMIRTAEDTLSAHPTTLASEQQRIRAGTLKQGWYLVKSLYDNGVESTVTLWVKTDENNIVIDRLAIKECRAQFPDDFGRDQATMRPSEVEAMYRLRNLGANDSFVQLRNWRRYVRPVGNEPGAINTNYFAKHRLYLEYCGHRELVDVIAQYANGANTQPIPEPFLWALFESLATVGNLMWRGDVELEREEWREIMHGDLKPNNVFIGDVNSNGTYAKLSRPKLGDFGHAIMWPRRSHPTMSTARDNVEDANNDPWDQDNGAYAGQNYCTEGFQSPVHIGHVFDGAPRPKPPNSKTNAFGIGLILWCMIKREPDGLEGYVNDYDWDLTTAQKVSGRVFNSTNPFDWAWSPEQAAEGEGQKSVVFTPAEISTYSDELRDLVMHCMQYHPDNRPQFDEVLRRVKQATRSATEDPTRVDRARGLRTNSTDPRWAANVLRSTDDGWHQGDQIDVGLATVNRNDPNLAQPPRPTLAQIRKRKRQEDNDLGSGHGYQMRMRMRMIPPDDDDDFRATTMTCTSTAFGKALALAMLLILIDH